MKLECLPASQLATLCREDSITFETPTRFSWLTLDATPIEFDFRDPTQQQLLDLL